MKRKVLVIFLAIALLTGCSPQPDAGLADAETASPNTGLTEADVEEMILENNKKLEDSLLDTMDKKLEEAAIDEESRNLIRDSIIAELDRTGATAPSTSTGGYNNYYSDNYYVTENKTEQHNEYIENTTVENVTQGFITPEPLAEDIPLPYDGELPLELTSVDGTQKCRIISMTAIISNNPELTPYNPHATAYKLTVTFDAEQVDGYPPLLNFDGIMKPHETGFPFVSYYRSNEDDYEFIGVSRIDVLPESFCIAPEYIQ